jgi:hypothetical protein
VLLCLALALAEEQAAVWQAIDYAKYPRIYVYPISKAFRDASTMDTEKKYRSAMAGSRNRAGLHSLHSLQSRHAPCMRCPLQAACKVRSPHSVLPSDLPWKCAPCAAYWMQGAKGPNSVCILYHTSQTCPANDSGAVMFLSMHMTT